MPRSFPRGCDDCTGKLLANLPEKLDAIDRKSRHALDTYIGRDGRHFALYSGLSQQQVNRQREYLEGVASCLAKLGRLVFAGSIVGRTFEDHAALLTPVADIAHGSLSPWLPVTRVEDLLETTTEIAAESLEAHCSAIASMTRAMADRTLDAREREALRPKLRRALASLQMLHAIVSEESVNENAGRG